MARLWIWRFGHRWIWMVGFYYEALDCWQLDRKGRIIGWDEMGRFFSNQANGIIYHGENSSANFTVYVGVPLCTVINP
jgi:hypothetical protein